MPATFTPTAALDPLTRVVDLSLTDEQEQLVEAFRAFFAKECPPTVVRDAEERGGFDADLWDAVVGARRPDDGRRPSSSAAGARGCSTSSWSPSGSAPRSRRCRSSTRG